MAIASKSEIHDLIEKLPESELHTVLLFLRFVHAQARVGGDSMGYRWYGRRTSDDAIVTGEAAPGDPVALALANAPEDDEPSSADEHALSEARWQAYRRGDRVSHEDVRREIGW
jgi:hypothetical protein